MARFIHTADLHLGRQIYAERLLSDQRHVLDQLVDLVRDRQPTALLIAGDVYDRSVPPAEAVEVLDDLVVRVAGELEVPVVMIPGNHDSAHRMGFGARLMGEGRLHIAGPVGSSISPVTVRDEHGEVEIFALPFLEPARVRDVTGSEAVVDQQSAWVEMLDLVAAKRSASRAVLVGHAFVQGGTVSDSERALSIGGAETIDAALFDGWSYVALGHLHRPQTVGSERVQYAGSPLKYSLSELSHTKSFTVVELDGAGDIAVERVPIRPLRDLRRVEGTLAELLEAGPVGPIDDYVVASLLDKGPVHEPMARLRKCYPNTLHIERPQMQTTAQERFQGADHKQMTLEDMFDRFFESVASESMTDAERQALHTVIADLRGEESAA